MNKLLKSTLCAGIVAVAALLLSFSDPGQRYFEIAKNLDIFVTLFKEVNALYVDEVNPNHAIKNGIDAMLASLDPYTNYIPEDDIEDFRTQSTGQYGGVGAVTSKIEGKVRVVMVMEGYPAQKGGLKIGDEILKIDDVGIDELSRQEAADLMKGQANTPVSLTVKRYNEKEPVTLTFTREKVKISNVPFYGMVTDKIGYVKLTEFTVDAGKEVKQAVVKLKSEGAEKLILDVRGNPGGLLMEAVNITNIFIPKGREVVSTKGKIEDNNQRYKTLNQPVDTNIPLAVLINSGSASASEIVAGTLQDYDRGLIIGRKSFGKGLVQITRPLTYNAQLKVTTAKYYTPSGRCIQALDYSHRNEDGSVGTVPDSLKSEFKTTNNRSVYDGGGIDPDIVTEKETMSTVAYTLYTKGLIFDYGTRYYYENDTIVNARNFALTDTEYNGFKQWVSDKDYHYTTKVDNALKKLRDSAKEEMYYSDIEENLASLEKTLEDSKENDLEDFKDQIIDLLEEDIISRYYLEKGAIESSFGKDRDVIKAIEILDDKERYNELLGNK